MKLKGLLIPNCVLELFYQWCDITGYNKVESNFMVFIEDAALYWNSSDRIYLITFPLNISINAVDNTTIKINSTGSYIVLYRINDEKLDWIFLKTYKGYLDEITKRNGTGIF